MALVLVAWRLWQTAAAPRDPLCSRGASKTASVVAAAAESNAELSESLPTGDFEACCATTKAVHVSIF